MVDHIQFEQYLLVIRFRHTFKGPFFSISIHNTDRISFNLEIKGHKILDNIGEAGIKKCLACESPKVFL